MPQRRRSVSQTHLLQVLTDELHALVLGEPRPLDVVDLGGGTGGLAMDLAGLGHRVVVVDPSPDALASLERRTSDAELSGSVTGQQGDATDLVAVVGEASADVVICHRVLEVVESPADALRTMATVLRPGGALSLLVSQRHALVLSQALAGHVGLARRTWADPTRFDYASLTELVTSVGLDILAADGIGAVAAVVPEAVIDGDATAYADLVALEQSVGRDPAFRALAPQVHLLARVPTGH